MFVELNGIGIDPDYIDELAEKLEFNMGNWKDPLTICFHGLSLWMRTVIPDVGQRDYDKKLGGVNPRSPKQLLQVFKDFGM